jgi:hypothetical protein
MSTRTKQATEKIDRRNERPRKFGVTLKEKPCLCCDNLVVTYLSANLVFTKRATEKTDQRKKDEPSADFTASL